MSNSNLNSSPKPNTKFLSNIADEYKIPEGMPLSVWRNKYARVKRFVENTEFDNDLPESNSNKRMIPEYQSWVERVKDVVEGNFGLDPRLNSSRISKSSALASYELENTLRLSNQGVMAYAGRHLQHGDKNQNNKIGELFSNCSTSMFSWALFFQLLKGSGCGRDYSSQNCWVDWDFMPNTRFVLDGPDQWGQGGHPDYEPWVESLSSAQHKYDSESEAVRWFTVDDSAEGWMKVVTILETAAFHKNNKDHLFIFDFSKIRCKGTPIGGQQDRPASGPIPFILALLQVVQIKGAGMKPWKQALFVDHFLASCVALGGIRRCLPEFYLVKTNNGWKKITDVEVNKDYAVVPEGEFLIVDLIDNGIQKTVFINTSEGNHQSTPEHRWLAVNCRNGLIEWVEAKNLTTDHSLMQPIVNDTTYNFIPVLSVSEAQEERVFDIEVATAHKFEAKNPNSGLSSISHNSARMATKYWKDRDVIEFADIKREGFLKTANNSILVDSEFWAATKNKSDRSPWAVHARRVFSAVTEAAYLDGTGEPGLINVDMLTANSQGLETVTPENYINPEYHERLGGMHEKTKSMIKYTLDRVKKNKYLYITNPCVTADTWVATANGLRQVSSLIDNSWVLGDDLSITYAVHGENVKGSPFFFTGKKPVYTLSTRQGYELKLTSNHKILTKSKQEYKWVEAKDLIPGDNIVMHKHELESTYFDLEQDIDGYNAGLNIGFTFGTSTESNLKSYMINQGFSWRVKQEDQGKNVLSEKCKEWNNDICTFAVKAMSLSPSTLRGFVAGIFDVSGSINTSNKAVWLKSKDKNLINSLQIILLRFGIATTKQNTDKVSFLHIDASSTSDFFRTFAISQTMEVEKTNQDSFVAEFVSLTYSGEEEVYDVHVPGPHAFSANGIYAHNCGEIVLSLYGGYCVIGDVCLTYAKTLEEARSAFGLMAKFLMRVNLMPMMYQSEVNRTNRIGVGIIGIFEFAWNHFGLTFRDIISIMEGSTSAKDADTETRALQFADFIASCNKQVADSAKEYAQEIGVSVPHTTTCLKPAGTIAKVMNSTEAANLPANNFYLRNNQYLSDDPQFHDLKKRGYPSRDISHAYPGHHVIGFPTKQQISDIMGDACVVVGDTSPEEQYLWLRWLEKYWLNSGDQENLSNNISYTLKYYPEKVSLQEFQQILINSQSEVKCCSWMQIVDMSKFAYQPEEPITKNQYENLLANIDKKATEDYDEDALSCEGGICPIERNQLVFVDGTKVNQ